MKNFFYLTGLLLLASCSSGPQKAVDGTYGTAFKTENPVSADQLSALVQDKPFAAAQVKGTIIEVCQHKGCWMTFKTSDGKSIYINTLNESFTLPKNAGGHVAIANGRVLSVDEQKRIAKENKEDENEITEIAFEATGIVIEK